MDKDNRMNFVLIHIGNQLPSHIKHCIKQIQHTNPLCNIYLITNIALDRVGDVKIINTANIKIPNIGTYYQNDPMGALFRTAMLRLFYLEAVSLQFNIQNIIHLDNDVLIYDDINAIRYELQKHSLCLTSPNEKECVFGFSYIKNHKSLETLNAELLKLIRLGEHTLEKHIGSMPHEMRLISLINNNYNNKLITKLPTLPTAPAYKNFKYCFDPSSYGQHLGGKPLEIHHHDIDEQIYRNQLAIEFNKVPIIKTPTGNHRLFNLHIHNKKLENYITYNTNQN